MTTPFTRENRYIVIKRSDVAAYHDDTKKLLDALPQRDAVVVEADWPEYEPTWRAIEERVNAEKSIGDAVRRQLVSLADSRIAWMEAELTKVRKESALNAHAYTGLLLIFQRINSALESAEKSLIAAIDALELHAEYQQAPQEAHQIPINRAALVLDDVDCVLTSVQKALKEPT